VIQVTDQIGVADSEAVERTVGHNDGAINATRLIGMFIEDVHGKVESRIGPGWVIS